MTQPDAGEAAWKVVEEWLRDEGMPGWTLDTAGSDKVHLAQRIAAHVRALVEEKEARIRELERLGMEEVERGLKLEAALAEREREVERLKAEVDEWRRGPTADVADTLIVRERDALRAERDRAEGHRNHLYAALEAIAAEEAANGLLMRQHALDALTPEAER